MAARVRARPTRSRSPCQTITVNNPANTTGTVSAPFNETFTTTNAIGTVSFSTASTLPNGITLSSSGVLSGTPTQNGPVQHRGPGHRRQRVPRNGRDLPAGDRLPDHHGHEPANAAGTVSAPFSETFTQSGAVGRGDVHDRKHASAGLTLANNGVLSGTPTQAGSFSIVVTVTDGKRLHRHERDL